MNITKPWMPAVVEHLTFRKSGRTPNNLVSVCVTNFNYSRYLLKCLSSIFEQTHDNLDLVIVDDCSKDDDSIEVARAWVEGNHHRFYRATLRSHGRNQGPSESRNTAFRIALGNAVFVMDSDNQIYPRAIARLHSAMKDGEFSATYSQLEVFGDRRGIGSADIWDPAAMAANNYVDVMALIKKRAWEKVDGYSHIDEGWEDYDFWLKFITHKLSVGYVPEVLCRYRVHDKSRTAVEAHAHHQTLERLMDLRHDVRAAHL